MTFYEVLGVEPTAKTPEIKRAYRELCALYHPDHNGGSRRYEQHLKHVQRAYEVLSDPEARSQYDSGLAQPGEDPEIQEAKAVILETAVAGGVAVLDAATNAIKERLAASIKTWTSRGKSPNASRASQTQPAAPRSRNTGK